MSSMNSYLGMARHGKNHRLSIAMYKKLHIRIRQHVLSDKMYTKVRIYPRKLRAKEIRALKKIYGKDPRLW
jgi:hypothetical protein